jgi:hypothetical protein
MQRLRPVRPIVMLLFTASAASLVALLGCGGGETTKARTATTKKGAVDPTELESTGWGELTGQVVYDGTPPPVPPLQMAGNADEKKCHEGAEPFEKMDQTWMVDATSKGVANVVIYLKPPDDKFFKIRDEDKKRTDTVELRQPHCVFIPHVIVLYPSYYDKETKDWMPSGQQFRVKNDASFPHNTKFLEVNPTITAGKSYPEEGKKPAFNIKPSYDDVIGFECNIHGWMRAKGRAFDHPYAATTDKDGKFTIPNVPTGVRLHVHGWHEDGTVSFPDGKTGSVEMQLDKTNALELKVKKK